MQLLLQLAVHRVQFLGSIERDDRHAIFHVGQDMFVSRHGCFSQTNVRGVS
jgi:hypothetical protein